MAGIGNPITTIRQGGDLPFVFDRDGESIEGFICTVTVKQVPGTATSIADFVVEAVGNTWPGSLTPEQTADLNPGTYYLVAKITNAANEEDRQIPERFHVTRRFSTPVQTFFYLVQGNETDVYLTEDGGKYLLEEAP